MDAIKQVKDYLQKLPFDLQVIEFEESTRTSELAAQAVGVEVGQIAKSLLFLIKEEPVLVVTSGDAKVQDKKLKKSLEKTGKVKMAPPEKLEELTGFQPGGVCPFALKNKIPIILDKSMERFPVVYTAAGSPSSAVPITIEQLLKVTGGHLADVCEIS